MELLNTLTTTAAGGTDNLVMANWKEGQQANGIRIRMKMPATVGVAGTPTLTDLRNLVAYFASSLTLRYGPAFEYVAYDGVPGNELIDVYEYVYQDTPYNDGGTLATPFVGTAQTTGAKTITCDFSIPFILPKLTGLQRRPGWTQGRTFRLEVVEGAALTAGALSLTRTGAANATIDVVPDYIPGDDTWTPVLSLRRINSPRLDAVGPPGLVVGAWDQNAGVAASTITKFRLYVGPRELHSNITPANVYAQWQGYIDQGVGASLQGGNGDFSVYVTPLYVVSPDADLDELPAGEVTFTLNNQDVATIKLRVLFFPELSESQSDQALEHAAKTTGQPILGTVARGSVNAVPGSHATRPTVLLRPDDARYSESVGIVTDPRTFVKQLHIPARELSAAGAVSDAMAHVAFNRRIPGATGLQGQARGGEHRAVGVAARVRARKTTARR